MGSFMKRTIALAVLVAAVGVLIKLAFKPVGDGTHASIVPAAAARVSADHAEREPDPKTTLAAKYATEPPAVRELVARVTDKFGRTSQTVERTDGLAGLVLLDRLDLEAIFLYEKHPTEFHRLRDIL